MHKVEKEVGYFKSHDGTEIYYESRGKGEPIVFVYGIACLINHWHYQIEYFSKNSRTIVFDLRGHHRSARPKSEKHLTLNDVAQDTFHLVKHLKLTKAHFVGHSFGVPILLKLFENHPQVIGSLTLINGFSKSPIQDMFGLGIAEKIYHIIKKGYQDRPELWKNIWRVGIDNPLMVPFTSLAGGFNLKLTNLKDIEIYTKGVAGMDLGVFLRLFEELMNFRGDKILPQISCPTLIIGGEQDGVTPLRFQREMEEHIHNSEFMSIPYGSHCTQLDFPEYLNLRLEKFFENHKIKKR